jgi:hypothetical protein
MRNRWNENFFPTRILEKFGGAISVIPAVPWDFRLSNIWFHTSSILGGQMGCKFPTGISDNSYLGLRRRRKMTTFFQWEGRDKLKGWVLSETI